MFSIKRFQIPSAPLRALTADAGPDIPGGEGANKGFWRFQWRDREGQFVDMGRDIKFAVKLPDGSVVTALGELKGTTKDAKYARVHVKSHPTLKPGIYNVESRNGTEVIATLDDATLDKADIKAATPSLTAEQLADAQNLADMSYEPFDEAAAEAPTLKAEVSGDEALDKLRSIIAVRAKKEGRFPVARDASDATAAAKEQHTSAFDTFKADNPEFADKFANADEYWDYISIRAADTNTRYEDSVDNIDPVMKAANRAYAKKVLGLEPDGMIELYRNAINHHDSEAKSAAGYMSLDKKMAWDYNSATEQITPFDGRYTIKVKPDEVSGLLGYSKAVDEFGVVVGPDVTAIPGRTKRVGDLEIQTVTPYIDDTKTFSRSGGGSPFRHFSLASQFDFHPTKKEVTPGESFADFYAANDLQQGAIPNKFNELYGEGAFEKAKAEFGQPPYKSVKDMFIQLPDGTWGLDPRALQEVSGPNKEENDRRLDYRLKFMSTLQELHGEPFMVSKGHSPKDERLAEIPTPEAPKPKVPSPASIAVKKPQAAPVAPIPDRPSATTNKPKQVPTTVYDRNKQPIVQGDTASFYIETEDGDITKIEGEYTGQTTASLRQSDVTVGARGPGRPIFRVRNQPGLKDGDYPIKMGTINLDENSPQFEKTGVNIAGSLERIERIEDTSRLTPLTEAQSSALFDYTTQNGFEDIRMLMERYPGMTLDEIADQERDDEDFQKTINDVRHIESAIYSSPLEEDTTLYRGIEFLDDDDFQDAVRALKVGQPIYDSSLQSTSTSREIAEKFAGIQGILFEIDAPKGSPALEVAPFHTDLFQIEDERLLPRNSELMIVEIGQLETTTTEWGGTGRALRVKLAYRPPLSKQERGKPTAQLTTPKHNVLNRDGATANGSEISIPASPEADALASISADPTPEVRASLKSKTAPLFTSDPENYTPSDPDIGMTKQDQEMLKTLTPTGEALYQYIDSSLKVNKALRNGDLAVETSDQVQAIDEAMLISPHLPPGATVYRMMKLQRWMKLDMKPGQVVFDRGFMSTTMSTEYVDAELAKNKKANAVNQIPMKIVMPNNTSGLDLTPISWFKKENEYLLPRNTGLRFLGWDSSGVAVFERVT